MELELALDPSGALSPRDLRFEPFPRSGRARTRPVRLTWHDTPHHVLAARGLALEERGGTFRLILLCPRAEVWPPGAPEPCVETAARLDAMTFAGTEPLEAPLTPVRLFEGSETTLTFLVDGESVTVTQRQGTVRAVGPGYAQRRVTLAGPGHAVHRLAIALAERAPIAIPRASFAAEALALTTGTAPAPRRAGAPSSIGEAPTVGEAIAHAVGHLTDVILYQASAAASGSDGPEPVHQARVATRRLRSALSLFQPVIPASLLDGVLPKVKALGAVLGPVRDWDVFVTETLPPILAAFPGEQRLDQLRGAANRRRAVHQTALRTWLGGPAFRVLGVELACLAAAPLWRPEPVADAQPPRDGDADPLPQASPMSMPLAMPLASYVEPVLHRRWKRLVAAGKDIEQHDAATLHAMRLKIKRLRYVLEIANLSGGHGDSRKLSKRLAKSQDQFGILNDRAVAAGLLAEPGGPEARHPFASGLILGFLTAHGQRGRRAVRDGWVKIRRLTPYWEQNN